jgi:hypothetical protein
VIKFRREEADRLVLRAKAVRSRWAAAALATGFIVLGLGIPSTSALAASASCATTSCPQAFPTFVASGGYDAGATALAFATGNLNGNSGGVVIAEPDGTDQAFVPDGTGGYKQTQTVSFNTYGITQFTSAALTVGDVNGDGKADLVEVAYGEGAADSGADVQCLGGGGNGNGCDLLIVALGNGDGTFQTPTVTPISWTAPADPSGVAEGLCSVNNPTNNPVVPIVESVALGDLNGDGHPDIVVGYNGAWDGIWEQDVNGTMGAVAVLTGNGDGSFTAESGCYAAVPSGAGLTNITEVAVADLNGDGHQDVVASNGKDGVGGSGGVTIWYGNGDGTLQSGVNPYPIPGPSNGLAVADMNGDGHPDIVVPDSANNLIYILDGSKSFTSLIGNPVATTAGTPSWPVVADFDGDGTPDVAVSNPAFSGTLLFNDGTGQLANPQTINAFVGNAGQLITAGRNLLSADVDGNGSPDLLALSSWGYPQLMVGLNQLPPPSLQASQVISFTSTPPTNPTYGGSYVVSAVGGGSGNPVVFSIDPASTQGACSVSGSTVSFTGVGICVIDANQAGDSSWAPAPQAQQSFSVGPAGSNGSVTAVSTSATATATATDAGATATAAGTGSVTVAGYTTLPSGSAAPDFNATGQYFDVSVGPGSSFSALTVTDCDLAGANSLEWLDGSTWQPVTPLSGPTGNPPCLTATLTPTTASPASSPTIDQLTGTVFAADDTLPSFSGPTAATVTTCQAVNLSVTASGIPAPTSITESGALPAGLVFSDSGATATISGTPGRDTGGVYDLLLTATSTGGTAVEHYTLTVDQPAGFGWFRPVAVGTAGQVLVVDVPLTGYPAPTVSAAGLPSGMGVTVTGSELTVSGIPARPGVYFVRLVATNSVGHPAVADLLLVVRPDPGRL